MMNRRKRRSNNRRGATAVEFAIIAPMILLFALALLEWGRFEMVRQVTSTAAFNAAREGTLLGASAADAERVANDIFDLYFVYDAMVDVTLTADHAQVNVSVPMNENSFGLVQFFGDVTLERSMRLATYVRPKG